MNKEEKIRAEIERLYNQSLADENRQAELGLKSAACTSYGKSKVCKELLSFIDSMQEEPVSEIDFETEVRKLWMEINTGHSYSIVDSYNIFYGLCMDIADWQKEQHNITEPTGEEQVKESFISKHEDKTCKENDDSLTQEPVSEDLEEAANEYAKDYLFTPKPQRAPNIHFINGANWQKQQMMAKAVDAVVKVDAGGYPYIDRTIELYDYDKDIPLAKKGDKYKVILIKED